MADSKEYVKLWVSYESYFEAFSDAEVGRLVRAMMNYRVSREEPKFSGNERFIWPAIRRDIDESLAAQEAMAAASRENGKKGGRPPKPHQKDGFNENQENQAGFFETQERHGKGQGQGQGKGQGNNIPSPPLPPTGKAAAVIADYLNRINASASQSTIDKLKGYAESMGPDVCKRAFDIALDSKKASWPYIQAILQDKQARGVKCLADWDELDARREESKPRRQNLQPACDRTAPDKRAVEDMERTRRLLMKMREEDST